MTKTRLSTLVSVSAVLCVGIGCPALADKALTAVAAETAPTLDGVADDAAWAVAPAVEIQFRKGANFGGSGSLGDSPTGFYTIDSVWFMYRKTAGTDPFDVFDWTKLTEGITPVADSTYPYEFSWDLATLTDGVLTLRLPKTKDASPRKISIG